MQLGQVRLLRRVRGGAISVIGPRPFDERRAVRSRAKEIIADKALAAAAGQIITLPGEAGTAALIKQLAARLLDLDRQIKDIDKQITNKFREHPSAAIIESMPGMGPHLGAEFLVITGGNMAASPMSYAVNGRQYVAISAGNVLFSFALPE